MPRATILDRWFPVPQYINPRSMGVDISDVSIKWAALQRDAMGVNVSHHGVAPLPQGTIEGGLVRDEDAIENVLRAMRTEARGIDAVHVALPEEAAYVFSMHIPPRSSREQALRLIEFEFEGRVPIPPAASVYDYDVIGTDESGTEIGVSVFPREVVDSYVRVCARAGLRLRSLELEARSVARATVLGDARAVTLLVDFGHTRTGFAVLAGAVPIFTSTVAMGGADITQAIMQQAHLTVEEAGVFKNKQGLLGVGENEHASKAASVVVQRLVDEVARHFHFWDTRRDERGTRMTPVERVLLVGGSSNIKGLTDVIAGAVHARVDRADVFARLHDTTGRVPPIDRRSSLGYATAIGLALRSL